MVCVSSLVRNAGGEEGVKSGGCRDGGPMPGESADYPEISQSTSPGTRPRAGVARIGLALGEGLEAGRSVLGDRGYTSSSPQQSRGVRPWGSPELSRQKRPRLCSPAPRLALRAQPRPCSPYPRPTAWTAGGPPPQPVSISRERRYLELLCREP